MSKLFQLSNECEKKFKEFQVGKSLERWISITLQDTSIVIKKLGSPDDSFQDFVNSLTPAEPCWYLLNFHYSTKDGGKRDRVLFVTWIPDDTNKVDKMRFAMYTSMVRRMCPVTHAHVQAHSLADFDIQTFLDMASKYDPEMVDTSVTCY